MGNFRGYPDCPVGWYNPGAVTSPYRHYSARGVDELVPVMKMQRDYVPRGVVVGECRDVGAAVSHGVVDRDLPLLRHLLSQYRKYARHTRASLTLLHGKGGHS